MLGAASWLALPSGPEPLTICNEGPATCQGAEAAAKLAQRALVCLQPPQTSHTTIALTRSDTCMQRCAYATCERLHVVNTLPERISKANCKMPLTARAHATQRTTHVQPKRMHTAEKIHLHTLMQSTMTGPNVAHQ